MTGLYHSLNVGAESLYATRQGVDTAGHNIANAQTEGYSRQRINLEQRMPLDHRGVIIGNGAFVKNISRAHDRFLEKQVNLANQSHGQADARYEALKALEGIFSPELNANIGDEMTSFFTALQDLANFPEELTVRTHLREAGSNLAAAFKRVDTSLRENQKDLNARIMGEVEEVNAMIAEIAKLNVDIGSLEAGEAKIANDLRDRQDALLRELNTRIEINYYRGDHGMLVVRGPSETLLVDRREFSKLATQSRGGEGGLVDILVIAADGNRVTNVTKTNTKGRLQGLIEVRDTVIEDLLQRNNSLAKALAENINGVHRQGFGLEAYKDSVGRDFFSISDDVNLAARSMQIASAVVEDTNAISVAASPNAPGDNILANEMLRVQSAKVLEGDATLLEYFANTVGLFGLEVVRTEHQKQAQDILKGDLNARREAISGVSMDEEAMNLMRWQSNFTASSRVITTVDEMLETVLSLKR